MEILQNKNLLPPELCTIVISYLPIRDIGVLSQVNWFWYECTATNSVWKERCFIFNPHLQSKLKDEGITSWKELYKEIAASLTWLQAPLDVPYQVSNRKKTVTVISMDECLILSNLPLLSNRIYYWEIKFNWIDERFERYIGVIQKKMVNMNQHKWALHSRMNQKSIRSLSLFKSGDTLALCFCRGQLVISIGGRVIQKIESIPMNDDPIFPYIVLYDRGDAATIVGYSSQLITKFAKASK